MAIRLAHVLYIFPFAWCASTAHAQISIHTSAQESTAPKYMPADAAAKAPIVGLCVDIDRALESTDPGLKFVGDQDWMPAKRVDSEIYSARLDMACGISKTPDRSAGMVFVEPPLFTSEFVLVARKDDKVNVENWEDVRKLGKDGIVLIDFGFCAINHLTQIGGLTLDTGASGVDKNLTKLKLGRARFYYHRLLGLHEEIKRANMQQDVRILPAVMDVQKFYMVFGRHVPQTAIERVQKALAVMSHNGELERIVQKWRAMPTTPAEAVQAPPQPAR